MSHVTCKTLWACFKLLSEASSDRLLIHYGDVLEFDIENSCKGHVKQTAWEDSKVYCKLNVS